MEGEDDGIQNYYSPPWTLLIRSEIISRSTHQRRYSLGIYWTAATLDGASLVGMRGGGDARERWRKPEESKSRRMFSVTPEERGERDPIANWSGRFFIFWRIFVSLARLIVRWEATQRKTTRPLMMVINGCKVRLYRPGSNSSSPFLPKGNWTNHLDFFPIDQIGQVGTIVGQ